MHWRPHLIPIVGRVPEVRPPVFAVSVQWRCTRDRTGCGSPCWAGTKGPIPSRSWCWSHPRTAGPPSKRRVVSQGHLKRRHARLQNKTICYHTKCYPMTKRVETFEKATSYVIRYTFWALCGHFFRRVNQLPVGKTLRFSGISLSLSWNSWKFFIENWHLVKNSGLGTIFPLQFIKPMPFESKIAFDLASFWFL